MIEPLYALRFHNGRRTRPEEETKVKKGVLGIKKKKTTFGRLLLHRKLSSELLSCLAFTESVKKGEEVTAATVRPLRGSTGPSSKLRLHPKKSEVLGLVGGPWGGAVGGQTLMSCDSTILARVFFTRRMVRREAGLRAQHSDISFSMARRHWACAHRWKEDT